MIYITGDRGFIGSKLTDALVSEVPQIHQIGLFDIVDGNDINPRGKRFVSQSFRTRHQIGNQ